MTASPTLKVSDKKLLSPHHVPAFLFLSCPSAPRIHFFAATVPTRHTSLIPAAGSSLSYYFERFILESFVTPSFLSFLPAPHLLSRLLRTFPSYLSPLNNASCAAFFSTPQPSHHPLLIDAFLATFPFLLPASSSCFHDVYLVCGGTNTTSKGGIPRKIFSCSPPPS